MADSPRRSEEAKDGVLSVFVVQRGQYSDQFVDAIFSTKDLAEAYVREVRACGDDTACATEFRVDSDAGMVARTFWRVRIDLETGAASQRGGEVKDVAPPTLRGAVESLFDKGPAPGCNPFAVVRSYESAEHALKLAAECRQEWLRKRTEPPCAG